MDEQKLAFCEDHLDEAYFCQIFFVEGGRGIKDLVDLTPEGDVDAVDEGDDATFFGDDILSASLMFTTHSVLAGLFGISLA